MSGDTDSVIDEVLAGPPLPIYLVSGEEFLVRKAADAIVKRLVPGASVGLNLALMDGASPREIAQELATMPLFPGPKVVLVRDPEFLAPKKGRDDALARARDAWKSNRRKEAARRILAIAARAGWGVAELDPSAPGAPSREAWSAELDVELAEADFAFLSEVAAFCREEGITAPESDATVLVDLLERGVPAGHSLVIAIAALDGKNPLVRVAKERGRHLVRGLSYEGKGRPTFKSLDLSEAMDEFLSGTGKRLDARAAAELKERVGGNMRTLQSELEKLSTYATGKTIGVEDVKLLVSHSREDEFGELQNAIQERNLAQALAVVREAIAQEKHGLQLLPGIATAFRSLLDVVQRVAAYVRGGKLQMSSREFEGKIFPLIERQAKAAGRKVPHPYAAYKAAEAAAKYDRAELIDALIACADADMKLKSGGDSKLVLDGLLVHTVAQKSRGAR